MEAAGVVGLVLAGVALAAGLCWAAVAVAVRARRRSGDRRRSG